MRISTRIGAMFVLALLVAGLAFGGGEGESSSTSTGSNTASGDPSYLQEMESPMLAARVANGELPPVEERLPKNPMVVKSGTLLTTESVDMIPGKYGGTMRLAQEGTGGDPIIFIGSNEPMLWAPNGYRFDEGIIGNVAERYSVNSNNTEFTLFLREGLRWSDGVEVTTADVAFAYELHLNPELTPNFPSWLKTGGVASGDPAVFEVIDDYTFKIKFTKPYGGFMARLIVAGWSGHSAFLVPSHYAKQFHIDYTTKEAIAKMMAESSIDGTVEEGWYRLFNDRIDHSSWDWKVTTDKAIGMPVLTPWMMVNATEDVWTYERNPYYFKVDEKGRQLPYIDKLQARYAPDKEVLTMNALLGEYDFLGERASLKSLSLFKEKEKNEGKIQVLVSQFHVASDVLYLNHNYPDPAWQDAMGNLKFRKALVYAIDYEEILETFFLGFGRVPQMIPAKYDPDEANRLLDEIGMNKRDSEGFRLGSDGKRFTIPISAAAMTEEMLEVTQLATEYLNDVGVHTTFKQEDWSLISQRANANEQQACVLWLAENMWDSGGWDDYLPGSLSSPGWSTYMRTGSSAEGAIEPPQELKDLWALKADFSNALLGSDESAAIMKKIRKNVYDNIWYIPLIERNYIPTFWSANMRNVPVGGKYDDHQIIVDYTMETWFFD